MKLLFILRSIIDIYFLIRINETVKYFVFKQFYCLKEIVVRCLFFILSYLLLDDI